jgi:preprotein translocase subunit SecY
MPPGIIFFCFFYTAVVFNPEETSENLKKQRRFHSRHPSGQEHRDLSRLCADPHHRDRRGLSDHRLRGARILHRADRASNMMFMGGTSLLIVVNVTVDTITQIQSHLLAHQYGDLIKKAKLKGRLR